MCGWALPQKGLLTGHHLTALQRGHKQPAFTSCLTLFSIVINSEKYQWEHNCDPVSMDFETI